MKLAFQSLKAGSILVFTPLAAEAEDFYKGQAVTLVSSAAALCLRRMALGWFHSKGGPKSLLIRHF